MSCNAIRYNMVETLRSPPLCRHVLRTCSSSFGRNFTLIAIPYLLKSWIIKFMRDAIILFLHIHIISVFLKTDFTCTSHPAEEAGELMVHLCYQGLQWAKPSAIRHKNYTQYQNSFMHRSFRSNGLLLLS